MNRESWIGSMVTKIGTTLEQQRYIGSLEGDDTIVEAKWLKI